MLTRYILTIASINPTLGYTNVASKSIFTAGILEKSGVDFTMKDSQIKKQVGWPMCELESGINSYDTNNHNCKIHQAIIKNKSADTSSRTQKSHQLTLSSSVADPSVALITHFKKGFFKHSCYPNPTSIAKDEEDGEEEEEEEYCIFINSEINRGNGMSVISKPRTFSESLEFILDLTRETEWSDTFNVVKMPEKGGVGVLASRALQRGDLVVNSLAVLLSSVEESTLDRPDWPKIRKIAVDLLPSHTRIGLTHLSHTHVPGQSLEDALSSAIDMNSFDISLGLNDEVPFFATFIKPAQLNHDCRPNTAFHIDSSTLKVHMHALRTIEKGEELTISYRNMVLTRAERQVEISDYGFKCTCEHCSMNDIEAEESDRRITRINGLSMTLNEWDSGSRNETMMLQEAEELVELYVQEKLYNNIPDGYNLAALTYNSFGHASRAQWFATKALEAGLISYGPAWDELESLGEIIDDPYEHWSYLARVHSD